MQLQVPVRSNPEITAERLLLKQVLKMMRLYKRGGVVPLQNPRAVRCVSVSPDNETSIWFDA